MTSSEPLTERPIIRPSQHPLPTVSQDNKGLNCEWAAPGMMWPSFVIAQHSTMALPSLGSQALDGKRGGGLSFYPKLLLTSPPSMSMAAPKEDTMGTISCFLTASILTSNVHKSKRTEMLAVVFQRHGSCVVSHNLVMSYSHLSEMTPFKVSSLVRTDLATTNCTESRLTLANYLYQQMTKWKWEGCEIWRRECLGSWLCVVGFRGCS